MTSVWSYFSLQAHCTECKAVISIYSGAFSVLVAHLRLEHNIILGDGDDLQGEEELKLALKEEVLDDADHDDQDNFDPYEEELDEDVKPKCIQSLQVKQEDETEKLEEEIYLKEDNSKESDTLEIAKNFKTDKHCDAENQLKRKKRNPHIFDKIDYFEESTDGEYLICKYCKQTIPENVLPKNQIPKQYSAPKNQMMKLKKHLLSMHIDKLSSSTAEYLTDQIKRHAQRGQEYRKRIKEVRKEEDYFEQSNETQLKRTKLENYTGEVFKKFDHFVQSNEDEENSEMICKYCEERFSSKALSVNNRLIKLKRHMLTMHEEKLDPFLADLMNRQFENSRRKKKEYKLVHKEAIKKKDKERNYKLDPDTGKVVNIRERDRSMKKRQIHKCPYEGCTQDAVSAFGLQAHIRARHTKEKPFQCSDCGKRFNLNSQLMNHKRVHSDEANFPCQYCEKRYKNYTGVVKHQTAGRGCEGLKRLQALGQLVPESRNYGNQ